MDRFGGERPRVAGGDAVLEEIGDGSTSNGGRVRDRIGLDGVLGEERGDDLGVTCVDGVDVGTQPSAEIIGCGHHPPCRALATADVSGALRSRSCADGVDPSIHMEYFTGGHG
jgi:hypothetical protein